MQSFLTSSFQSIYHNFVNRVTKMKQVRRKIKDYFQQQLTREFKKIDFRKRRLKTCMVRLPYIGAAFNLQSTCKRSKIRELFFLKDLCLQAVIIKIIKTKNSQCKCKYLSKTAWEKQENENQTLFYIFYFCYLSIRQERAFCEK